jgi:hypothetical protein
MFTNQRVDRLFDKTRQGQQGSGFIFSHEFGVAHHIGGQYDSKPAFHAASP